MNQTTGQPKMSGDGLEGIIGEMEKNQTQIQL